MDLEVEGRHTLLFDDDTMAAFVNTQEALVPWSGDESLLIDRYDVRHLLDRIPARPPRRHRAGRIVEDSGTVSQSDLDLERYLDLPLPDDNGDGPHGGDRDPTTESAAGAGSYQAVPFAYDKPNNSPDTKYSPGLSDSGFHPPFAVPESLCCNLPPSEKLHQIIARTAAFVNEHGGQSEIVLRVKQGDNPTFGFLMPDHYLYAYFRYLVDHPEVLKADSISSTSQRDNKSSGGENEMPSAAGGALLLLGSVYGSGEEDDITLQPDSEAMKPAKLDVAGSPAVSHRSEQGKPLVFTTSEDKGVIRHTATASLEEKNSISKRNHSMNVDPAKSASSKKIQDGNASIRGPMGIPQTSEIGISGTRKSIVEPPSFLKEAMNKIVEFISRNGKQFEAILIEQDKAAGRFPFLVPSNLYHSYYLKLLSEANELKAQSKNHLDQKNDACSQNGSKKRKQESVSKELTPVSNLAEESEVWHNDLQKKFKMIIGGQKKDTNERAVLEKRAGATADEAAAIVMAATRGQSPANVARRPIPARQSGASLDEAAAIVQAATRGSSPAITSQNTSVDEFVTTHTRGSGHASSIGSFSSLPGRDSILKLPSKDGVGSYLPVNSPGSLRREDKDGCGITSDVLVAKAIAKTVALEADSSEACLIKEQKLKADRLKRAKMFAALIKSGSRGITEGICSVSVPNGSLEASNACSNSGSVWSGVGSDLRGKEKEGSSMPIDAGISGLVDLQEKDSMYDCNSEQRSRKKQHSRPRDHEELEEDHSHSRKRHRYDHSSHNSRGHGKSNSSEAKESRQHHKRHRSPVEQRKHVKSHHRHRDGSSEDDEGRRRDDRHHRKDHSYSRRKHKTESEGEVKTSNHSEKSLPSSDHHQNAGPVSDARPSDSTEVPSELRAKIRAMLLETMQ